MQCNHPTATLDIQALSPQGQAKGRCGVCGRMVRVQYSQTWDDDLDPILTDALEAEQAGELPGQNDFDDPEGDS